MIALNFNDPVFHRAACSACLFEFSGQILDALRMERYAGNDGHPFALAPFRLSAYPDYAVAFRRRILLPASAGRYGFAAVWEHPAVAG